jgi:hypothetical protein
MIPNTNMTEDTSNLLSINELKINFIEKMELDLKPENIRFFCLGKELQDDLFLYSYDIKDEMAIQCMQRKM